MVSSGVLFLSTERKLNHRAKPGCGVGLQGKHKGEA